MKIIESPSPNFGPRAAGKEVSFLILHYTSTKTAKDAIDILHSVERAVSAHYVVDEDGTVYRLVSEDNRAWHAGKSYWEGETDINSCSVGIEIQNPGHGFGYREFPRAQIDAVKTLSRDIILRHGILPRHVLGHSDIAPGRADKKDPGPLFPWKDLAADGIGVWPEIKPDDKGTHDLAAMLHAYGYDPTVDLNLLVTAFQRHFQPEIFKTVDDHGKVNDKTLPLLHALLKEKT